MSGSTQDHLVYMANQIARNFAVRGDDAAVAATADHIKLFWDPRMIAAIKGCETAQLSPIAAQAVARLQG